jgi:hypothetical protein
MKKFETKFILLLALVAISLSGVATPALADEKETFTADVLFGGGYLGEMIVEHWTTTEEMQKLLQALNEGGSDVLFKEIRKMRAGRVLGYFGPSPGKPGVSPIKLLNLAFSQQTEKGRLIHLVIDRPIYFDESQPLAQPQDYEFGLIEFILPEKGEGQGTHFPTARIGINKDGKIEFRPLGTEPQKLTNVTKIK